jgi:hypothetical protein
MWILVALALPAIAFFSLEASRGQIGPRPPFQPAPALPGPQLPRPNPFPNGFPRGIQGMNNPNPNGVPQGFGGMGNNNPKAVPQGFGGMGINNPNNQNGMPRGIPENPLNRPTPNVPQGQGFNPNPPMNNFAPNFTMRENAWFCSKCNREVGRGPVKPNIARCPFCSVRFNNTEAGGFDGTVGAIIGVVVLVVFGIAGFVVRALRA